MTLISPLWLPLTPLEIFTWPERSPAAPLLKLTLPDDELRAAPDSITTTPEAPPVALPDWSKACPLFKKLSLLVNTKSPLHASCDAVAPDETKVAPPICHELPACMLMSPAMPLLLRPANTLTDPVDAATESPVDTATLPDELSIDDPVRSNALPEALPCATALVLSTTMPLLPCTTAFAFEALCVIPLRSRTLPPAPLALDPPLKLKLPACVSALPVSKLIEPE
jgi:hypothetical protein